MLPRLPISYWVHMRVPGQVTRSAVKAKRESRDTCTHLGLNYWVGAVGLVVKVRGFTQYSVLLPMKQID